MSFGPGGMPRSRHQQEVDDMLTSSAEAPLPQPSRPFHNRAPSRNGGRTNTMGSLTKRGSNSSNQSRNFFSAWGRKSKGGGGDFDEDEGVEDDFDMGARPGGPGYANGAYQHSIPRAPSSLGGASAANSSNDGMTMNDISGLRDRDRYPTFGGAAGGGSNNSDAASTSSRTMSITSMTGGFDTTPIIPTFRGNEGLQNNNYRKNLTNNRKQALRTSDGVAIPPQQPMPPQQQMPPPGYKRGPPPPHMRPGYRGPTSPTDSRLRSMTGLPPSSDGYSERNYSITNNTMDPSKSPPMDRLSYGRRPGSRTMSIPEHPRPPMVTTSTMTEPMSSDSLPTSSPVAKMVDRGHEARSLPEPEPIVKMVEAKKPAAGKSNANPEMAEMNKSLLDEIRLVTNELADSIRRELGVDSLDEAAVIEDSYDPKARAKQVVELQQQLDLERRKRLLAESHLNGDQESLSSLHASYEACELDRELMDRERRIKNEQMENKLLQDNVVSLTEQLDNLQQETNQLKDGIVPELKSHVKDLEVLTAAGNPIELLKQIEELKIENKKMEGLLDDTSNRGPIGEKVKTIESQRDALREALRSLRERKDHEIRQSSDRVRQLESKLERERVVNHQMQRKIVQTSLRSTSTPALNAFPPPSQSTLQVTENNSNYSSSTSSPTESNGLSIPKRRGLGQVSGIVPPTSLNPDSVRSPSPSPVSFEINQEPAWLDYVDPSKLPSVYSNGQSRSSTSSLNKGDSLL